MVPALLLAITLGTCVCEPKPPQWEVFSSAWNLEAPNGTILSRHQWYFDFKKNIRTVLGHFYESGSGASTRPMGGFADFTAQTTIRYTPTYGLFGTPQPCKRQAWNRNITHDRNFNNLGVPEQYTYLGTRMVNGVLCNGWHFIAVNYPHPEGNELWTEVGGTQRPVVMNILWNGRKVVYTDWHMPPQADVSVVQSTLTATFCSSVSDSSATGTDFESEVQV